MHVVKNADANLSSIFYRPYIESDGEEAAALVHENFQLLLEIDQQALHVGPAAFEVRNQPILRGPCGRHIMCFCSASSSRST